MATRSDRVTAVSSEPPVLHAGTEPHRRCRARPARAEGPLAHYGPGSTTSAATSPTSSTTRLEQLFHEKAVTGRAAWTRLFDETITALRFDGRRRGTAAGADAEPAAGPGRPRARAAAAALGRDAGRNDRTFALITNTLSKDLEIADRWRGFEDVADSRHLSNRVEREVVDALVEAVQAAYPRLSHRYYSMKARWFGARPAGPLGPQRAPARRAARDRALDRGARHGARRLRGFSPELAGIARRFFDSAGSTPRSAPARRRAPSRTRPCRRRIPTC